MRTTRPVAAVVFDIGGVLLEWDPGLAYRELIPDPPELEWFLAEVCTPEWNATLDAGRPFDEDPARTLFVDDAETNVRGARDAGFRSHHFVDPPTLALELRSHGLIV